MLMPISVFSIGLIENFEWLEPNNRVEIVIGEPYQLHFSCSDNRFLFTNDYASSWVHIDFEGGQHVVSSPTGYSIDNKGVITGLAVGSYAIHPTGWIQAKSGVDKWLNISVVSERSETEPNNTFDTANDVYTKIRFGLHNTTDIDFFKFTNSSLKWGDNVTFKIHYYGSKEEPFGYKWATFCGTEKIGSGSLVRQDQECKALVTSEKTVYLEVYYDQSRSQYFNNGEEFVVEMYINGELVQPNNNNEETDNEVYVDLGLPSGLLWATCNLGSESKFVAGDKYSWGETSTKSFYEGGNYKWFVDFPDKYSTTNQGSYVDNKAVLDKEDDAAYVILGEGWRIPTVEDWKELREYCTWSKRIDSFTDYKWVSVGTASNGNSIYLPVTGVGEGGGDNVFGLYWTSSLYPDDDLQAYIYICAWESYGFSSRYRYEGYNIRPVYDPNYTSIRTITDTDKSSTSKKYVRNGQIVIERNGKKYSTTGIELK